MLPTGHQDTDEKIHREESLGTEKPQMSDVPVGGEMNRLKILTSFSPRSTF